jgi:hypothetical protein
MSTLPSASKIVSTTFNKDLNYVFSVTQVYTVTVAYIGGGTGGEYSGTVTLNSGYNTTNYNVFPSVVCTPPDTDSGQYVYPVIITSRTASAFTYSIYVAAGFGSTNQTITLDFLVIYYLPQVLNGNFNVSVPALNNSQVIRPGVGNTMTVPNWTFNNAIIAKGYNILWDVPEPYPPPGNQYVILQIANNAVYGGIYLTASISQAIWFDVAGTYKLSWSSVQRLLGDGTKKGVQVNISIDSIVVYSYTPTSLPAVWATYTYSFVIASAGQHTLTISAYYGGTDIIDRSTAVKGFVLTSG